MGLGKQYVSWDYTELGEWIGVALIIIFVAIFEKHPFLCCSNTN